MSTPSDNLSAIHDIGPCLDSPLPSTEQIDGSVLDIEMRSLKSEIKAWEREFSKLHNKKPTKDDVLADKDILELYKRYSKMKTDKKSLAMAATEEVLYNDSDISKSTSLKESYTALSSSTESTSFSKENKHSASTNSADSTNNINREAVFKQKELNRARAFVDAGKVIENNLSATVSPKKVSLNSTTEPASASLLNTKQSSSEEFPSLEDVLHPTLYFIHPDPSEVSRPRKASIEHPLPILEEKEENDVQARPQVGELTSEFDDVQVSERKVKEEAVSQELTKSECDAPLLQLSTLIRPPPQGKTFLGTVERVRAAARPTCSFYRFVSEQGNYSIASARRELKLSLTPTYYLFDRAHAEYSMKESARWKIKGNFEGSLFKITERLTGDLLGLVHYTSSSIPRAMTVVYTTEGSIPSNIESFLIGSNFMVTEIRSVPNIVVLKNKLPKYNTDMRTYCLNFNGRVTLPSVKNFQLSAYDESEIQLQFGRVGKDVFSIDVSFPLPMFMAFAICLSSFDAVEKV